MASSNQHDDDGIVGINVTPLVDVTLVLLVIFMVTAKLIASSAVPFDLPKAATAGATQSILSVVIDAEGHTVVDGASIANDEDLRAIAGKALQRESELRTVIQASKRASHGDVI